MPEVAPQMKVGFLISGDEGAVRDTVREGRREVAGRSREVAGRSHLVGGGEGAVRVEDLDADDDIVGEGLCRAGGAQQIAPDRWRKAGLQAKL